MLNRFYQLGGEAWFNCEAQEFLFENNALCGVRTSLGVVDTKMCLANINPEIIYGKMMKKELVPVREKKLIDARKHNGGYSARMFTVYFGLDCDYKTLGITNYAYFLGGSSDTKKEYTNINKSIDSNQFCIFLCVNVASPEASPKGTCICSITTMGSSEEWSNVTQENYVSLKEKFTDKMIKLVKDKTGIDMTGHIEEVSIASPLTFARYLNSPEGSVYGYEAATWDGIMARLMSLKEDYPIKGLRPIGAAGPRGDGYSAAYICGSLVGKLALKDLREWEGK